MAAAVLSGCQPAPVTPATPSPSPISTGASSTPSASSTAATTGPDSTAGPAAGLARFDGPGWHFDYPATWSRHRSPLGGRQALDLGFVTNEELDFRACTTHDDKGPLCLPNYRIPSSGGLVVHILEVGSAYGSIRKWDRSEPGATEIDGVRAAKGTFADSTRHLLSWDIANPSNAATSFSVTTEVRRDGDVTGIAAVETLMASWRFDPPFNPPNPAETPPFAAQAVRDMKAENPTYACVPEEPGRTVTTTVTKLDTSRLLHPLEVTCSASIGVTSGMYWLVRLEVRWKAQGGSRADADVIKRLLTVDGVSTWGSDRNASPPYCCR